MAGTQSLLDCCAPCVLCFFFGHKIWLEELFITSLPLWDHVSYTSEWQVSELSGTWGLRKEKILQALAAYAMGTRPSGMSKSQVSMSLTLSM